MSSPDYTLISQGTVYDPANGIDGLVKDLWILNGRIVDAPTDPSIRANRIIDAQGLVVMPGGIDMHSHFAGPKVNVARKMRPEEKRDGVQMPRTNVAHSGSMGSVPSTFATGYKYAALGYTAAFDAAIPPLGARHAHEELEDTPCIDKGFFVLMGNNHYVMQSLAQKDTGRMRAFIAWLLSATKGFAPKLVNPGGVEVFKQRSSGDVSGLDSIVDHFNITPRQIIQGIAQAANEIGLPHPIHIHCNNLGMPGNWKTTLDTMQTLEGYRGHITHIQFHSYGGGEGDENTFNSKVLPLVDYVNSHPNITIDVGQVMFGDTTSMTGDGPVGYYLSKVFGKKWFSSDTEMESGCGITPIKYRNKSLVHSLQWAIGLEWYLLVNDPWRVAMSTDHPNGGSFLTYPQIIRLLMDRNYRQEMIKECPLEVRQRSSLWDIQREYTLNEIAIITRAAPARILGLPDKGHLGPGADADITIYTPHDNKQIMFEMPRLVIKAGRVIVENSEIRETPIGKTLHVQPDYDPEYEAHIKEWFEKFYSVSWRNYPVDPSYLHESCVISTLRGTR
jgi:formylmethanofuran dehydrogenase subunit A